MSTYRKPDRHGGHYHYYGCSHNQRYGAAVCAMGNRYRAEEIERAVLGAVAEKLPGKPCKRT
jgi:hypothetical protein